MDCTHHIQKCEKTVEGQAVVDAALTWLFTLLYEKNMHPMEHEKHKFPNGNIYISEYRSYLFSWLKANPLPNILQTEISRDRSIPIAAKFISGRDISWWWEQITISPSKSLSFIPCSGSRCGRRQKFILSPPYAFHTQVLEAGGKGGWGI